MNDVYVIAQNAKTLDRVRRLMETDAVDFALATLLRDLPRFRDQQGAQSSNQSYDLAELAFELGYRLRQRERSAEAVTAFDAAIELMLAIRAGAKPHEQWDPQLSKDLAATYVNRGYALTDLSRFDEAISAHDAAIELRQALRSVLEPREQWAPELRNALAAAYVNRGNALFSLNRLNEAVSAFNAAIEINQNSPALLKPQRQWAPELCSELADAHINRGSALYAQGLLSDAVVDYDAAIELRQALRTALEPDRRWTSEECNDLAAAHVNRGNALYFRNGPTEAMTDFDTAIELRQALRAALEPQDRWSPKFRNDLATTHMNRGNAVWSLDRRIDAVGDYDNAIDLMQSLRADLEPAKQWSPKMGDDLVKAHMNRGIALESLGRLTEAVADNAAAIELSSTLRARLEPNEQWTPELRNNFAAAHMHHGNSLQAQGHLAEAVSAYDVAIKERQALRATLEPDRRWTVQQGDDLAAAHMNRGNTLRLQGRFNEALVDYDTAIKLRRALGATLEPERRWSPGLRNALASTHTNRGKVLVSLDRLAEAVASYEAALELRLALRAELEPTEQWVPGLRNDLANTYAGLGYALNSLGHLAEALAAYDTALTLMTALRADLEPVGQWAPERCNDLAGNQMNRGKILDALGRGAEAVAAYDVAIETAETLPLGAQPKTDVTRFMLYANTADLLAERDDPHDFARTKSRAMADLLELTLAGDEQWDFRRQLREQFARFHAHWLRFSVSSASTEVIPEILAVLQGRDLAAAVSDQLDHEHPDTPETVREFQRLRLKLRHINARIRAVNHRASASEGAGGQRDLADLNSSIEFALPAEYQELVSEHGSLLEKLRAQRDLAAQERGYEALNPSRAITTEKLRQALGNTEALLLLIDLGDGAPGMLLVPRNQPPQWYPLANADRFAKTVQWAGQSLGRGRAYRNSAHDAVAESNGEPVDLLTFLEQINSWTKDERQTYPRIDPTTAWQQIAAWQAENLWNSIAPSLHGIQRVHCMTHGALHLLPLEAGAPQGIHIARYPGLVFFAERRGIFVERQPQQITPEVALSLDVNAAKDTLKPIPMVDAEAAALHALHAEHGEVVRPGHFPQATRSARLVHLSCHGGGDPARPNIAVLHLHPDTPVSEGILLDNKQPLQDVYINACIAGWTVEDRDGSPSGLISALFQKGARQVIGALVSISDYWSCVLALLTHQAMLRDASSLDAALAEGKHRLASGDWYPDTKRRLIDGMTDAEVEGPRLVPIAEKLKLVEKQRTRLEWGRGAAERRIARDEALEELLPNVGGWDEAALAALRESLASLEGETWDQAFVDAWEQAERIPPQPDLGALLYGVVVFGEA